MNPKSKFSHGGNTLTKGKVKVEWAELGEGLSGDYNPNNPDDVELLRFDVSLKYKGSFEAVDDASYCTQVPVKATQTVRKRLLSFIMSEVYEPLAEGNSIKKLCERLSWLTEKGLQ